MAPPTVNAAHNAAGRDGSLLCERVPRRPLNAQANVSIEAYRNGAEWTAAPGNSEDSAMRIGASLPSGHGVAVRCPREGAPSLLAGQLPPAEYSTLDSLERTRH